ncbi:MAG TPA: paraquat-inducible protein A [Acetobacteraceae bacterium]|nr:paraquat-inducible protein A [Acetobacteraceae bacterium]
MRRPLAGSSASPAQWRECPGCGLVQLVPALQRGLTAQCIRCPTTLHRTTTHPIGDSIAITFAALVMLIVMSSTTLMGVQTAGISHTAYLLSGPAELVRRNMSALAAVVVFVTLIAPLGKLCGTLYVLIRVHENQPPAHLRAIFAWVERLRPWSMIEVFVFGVFVAYVKLGDLVHITLDIGVYALIVLMFLLIWADTSLDRQAVWQRLDRSRDAAHRSTTPVRLPGAIGCEVCGLVAPPRPDDHACRRCDAPLHPRKPDSVARTWALVLAAAVLYVPANYYPVLTVMQLGAGSPSTIIGGVRELVASGMYPLAALVFFASIAVPMLKLIGLSTMLATVQFGRTAWLRDRTRLYHVVRWIGRWSMIDIFMEALLGALVHFGSVITIEPGMGAVAFCAVVILTMFAAETFDPRLMWDAAERRSVTLPGGAAVYT